MFQPIVQKYEDLFCPVAHSLSPFFARYFSFTATRELIHFYLSLNSMYYKLIQNRIYSRSFILELYIA